MKKILSIVFCVVLAAACACVAACGGEKKTFKVTFVQEGQTDIVYEVEEGGSLDTVPAPAAVDDYDVVWDRTDFTDIREDITVTAVKTLKKYTVTYDLGKLAGSSSVTLINATVTVESGAEFTPDTPVCRSENVAFVGWVIKDTDAEFSGGKYDFKRDITLVAVWEVWTPLY